MVNMTMGVNFEDKVVGGIESEIDTRDSYKLDLLILEDNYAENLFFCNLAVILANIFGNLLPILIDFRSSPLFPVFSSHFLASNSRCGPKPLNSTLFNDLTTCNPVIFLSLITK